MQPREKFEKEKLQELADSIESLKELISEKNLNAEDVNIYEVDTSEEKWSIKTIPWSKISWK